MLASLHESRRDIEALRHRLDLLLRRLYGPRGERFNPDQPLLFAEAAAGLDMAPESTNKSSLRRMVERSGQVKLRTEVNDSVN